jgi:hypothetical protein
MTSPLPIAPNITARPYYHSPYLQVGVMEYYGICITCTRAGDCTYARDPGRPVWDCEDFVADTKAKPNPFKSHHAKERSTNQKLGLCENCSDIETCTYPKPEGGVWCCEQYQQS